MDLLLDTPEARDVFGDEVAYLKLPPSLRCDWCEPALPLCHFSGVAITQGRFHLMLCSGQHSLQWYPQLDGHGQGPWSDD